MLCHIPVGEKSSVHSFGPLRKDGETLQPFDQDELAAGSGWIPLQIY